MKFTNVFDSNYTKSIDQGLKSYILSVYKYVALGLLMTGFSAFITMSFSPFTNLVFNIQGGVIYGFTGLGTIIGLSPIFIGIYFFWGFGSISIEKAKVLFWVYAFAVGVSTSSIGFIYTGQSIFRTFFITASAFGLMSIYGYKTKKDLTSLASMFTMVLLGVLFVSLINIFLGNSMLYFLTSILGVIAFMGLIAWNTQKIKSVYYNHGGGELAQKYAVMSAFQLYLDFINLFFYLIRFFGYKKD